MSLLVAIIIGVAVGLLVDFFLHGHVYNFALNSLVGIVGSIIGLAVFFFFFNFAQASISLFSYTSALCSLIAALIITFAIDGLQSIAPRQINKSHVEEDSVDED
jgi:uncharacterized membrane protein YeaQ/YmgE (transglycosylase-associated protein family)